MSKIERHPELLRMVRFLRIFVGLIAAGLATFIAVVLYLHYGAGQDQPPEGAELVTNVSLAVAGVAILISTLARSSFVRSACLAWRAGDPKQFQQKYAMGLMVGIAGIEGAGFMMCVAFLLEKDVMALTAACICLLLLLVSFPSRNRVDALLEQLP